MRRCSERGGLSFRLLPLACSQLSNWTVALPHYRRRLGRATAGVLVVLVGNSANCELVIYITA